MNDGTEQSGVIQTVRRKLAALFGSVSINAIPVANVRPATACQIIEPCTTGNTVQFGRRAAILSTTLLAEGRSEDVCRVSLVDTRDAVSQLAEVAVCNGMLGEIAGKSEPMSLSVASLPNIGQLQLLPADIGRVLKPPHSSFDPPIIRVADVNRPRSLTKADRRAVSVRLNKPRIGLMPPKTAADIAMERRREPMLSLDRSKPPVGFEREMALLKAASGEPDANIKLVGVYCSVPIGAASRVEFDPPTGSLMLNIRENAHETIGSTKRPVVTLVLGQIISTGRMVRAFRPEPS